MGFLAALSGLFGTPITFFEHEGREMAETAKVLLESRGIGVSMIDEVTTDEWGTSYVINVSSRNYKSAKEILTEANIL